MSYIRIVRTSHPVVVCTLLMGVWHDMTCSFSWNPQWPTRHPPHLAVGKDPQIDDLPWRWKRTVQAMWDFYVLKRLRGLWPCYDLDLPVAMSTIKSDYTNYVVLLYIHIYIYVNFILIYIKFILWSTVTTYDHDRPRFPVDNREKFCLLGFGLVAFLK